jgi:4-hydroxy-3-polyprenylbenzoate decarboxylase
VLSGLGLHDARTIEYHHYNDLTAPLASGSYRFDSMVIVPCSCGTLGRIAAGSSTNLIERASEVCLKERRKLVLVPRETPYSRITIDNMLRLHDAGSVILPASPGFYAGANAVQDLVNFVVSRILDNIGIENNLVKRYSGVLEEISE